MENQSTGRKRPIWIWLIAIFYFLSGGWVLFSSFLIFSGAVPLSPAQQEYFDSLSIIDYVSFIGAGLLNIIGAVALFLLRKIAVYLFASSLGLNFVLIAWHGFTKGYVEAVGGPGLVGGLIGTGLSIAVCLYAWKLVQKGTLR